MGDVVDPAGDQPGGELDPEHRSLILGVGQLYGEDLCIEGRSGQRRRRHRTRPVPGCAHRVQRQQVHRLDGVHPRLDQDLGGGDHHRIIEFDRLGVLQDGAAQVKARRVQVGVPRRTGQRLHSGQRERLILPLLIVGDEQMAGAVQIQRLDVVLQPVLLAHQQNHLAVVVGEIQDPGLVVFGIAGGEQQFTLIGGEVGEAPQLFVVDLNQQSVLVSGGAEAVLVEPVGPPGGIGNHVEGALAGRVQDRAAMDVLHNFTQILSGAQVAEAQGEVLVTGGVLCVGQQGSGVVVAHPADGVEGVLGGLGVGVEVDLLALQRDPGFDLWGSPGSQRR